MTRQDCVTVVWINQRVVEFGCQNSPPSQLRFKVTDKIPKFLMNKMRKQKLGYILYSIRGLIILKSISILQYKGKVVKFNLKE